MTFATASLLALPGPVVLVVALASILMAGAVVVFGILRWREGFDPMLLASAAAVVVLAVAILLTR
jgi:hypothetical protein